MAPVARVTSISILSIILSKKPPQTLGKRIRFLKRVPLELCVSLGTLSKVVGHKSLE